MKTFLIAFGTWFLTNLIGAFVLKFLGIQISEGLVLVLNVITISFAIFVALSIRRRQLKKRKEEEELNSVAAEDISSEPTPPTQDILMFEVAGLTYRSKEAQERAEILMSNESVYLKKEPTNPYDSNAIKVYSSDHVHLGYVPKYLCSEILEKMDDDTVIAYVDYVKSGKYCPFVHLYMYC